MVSMRQQLLLAALILSIRNAASASESKITASDRETALQAQTKSVTLCQGIQSMDAKDKEGRKNMLVSASGNRLLEQVIKEADNKDQLLTKFQEKANDPKYNSTVMGPLVMMFLSIFIYAFCCCWTPCCECCRCCRKSRNPGVLCKLFFLFLVVGLMCGLGVAAILARAGLGDASNGVDMLSCATADFAHVSLNGKADPRFLGLIPAIESLEDMASVLNPDGTFITQLKAIIDSTASISQSVLLASTTLTMLSDMMTDTANILPKDASSVSLEHKCQACQPIGNLLGTASTALSSGLGAALAAAREEVDKQLSGSALASLQNSMTSAMSPIDGFKSALMGMFEPIVKSSAGEDASKAIDSMGMPAVGAIIALAVLIVLCASCTTSCWLLCDKTGRNEGAYIHRCACTTWCCGCWYIWLVFFFGGLLAIICVPLSGACLILDDLNSAFLKDVDQTFNLGMAAGGEMVFNIVDQCLNNPDPNANPMLLSLINITDTDGKSVTMYQKIVVSTKDSINSAFNQITSITTATGSASPKINADASIVKLRATIADLQTDAMLLPVDPQNTYGAMAASTALAPYLASSGACLDYTPTVDDLKSALPAGTPLPVKGIGSFATELGSMGVKDVASGYALGFCGDKVVCDLGLSSSDQSACTAGNSFMDVKHRLRTVNTFQCRRFVDKDGLPCDILSMAKTSSGTYTGDCMRTDNTWKVETYPCTLSDFTTLVQQFDQMINLVTQRIDDTTDSTMTKISTDMKQLVNTNILDKIDNLATGVTCGFMGTMWQRIIDGFCFNGVIGFISIVASYNSCASVTLVLVILLYIVWRITFDNYQFRQQGGKTSLNNLMGPLEKE